MKNSIYPSTVLRWFDLAGVAAIIQPHQQAPAMAHCTLVFRGHEQAHVLLLADGMFSIVEHSLGNQEDPLDDVCVALGRVIASHAALGQQLLGEAALQRELRHVEATGRGPLRFGDLPEVTLTLGVPEPDFVECVLRSGAEAALVVLVRDDSMPFGWIRFSSLAPGRILLCCLGRILAAQYGSSGVPAD